MRPSVGLGPVLAMVLLFAGCLEPAADAPSPTEGGEDPQEAFGPGRVVLEGCGTCYEPSVAVDGAGRIVATSGSTRLLALSEDGGATWETLKNPPMPEGIPARQGDILYQAAPDGRLYFSALLLRMLPDGSSVLEGIQVAATNDGGRTWEFNQAVTPLATPTDAVYAADRQWLGFAQDGAVYLTYNQIPTGIWSARSDDGGRTWGAWTRALPLETRGGLGQSGPPVADADGQVVVAGCALGEGVAIAGSADRGVTWGERSRVGADCTWFPILFHAADGLGLAYVDTTGRLRLAFSDDSAATWSEPVLYATGTTSSPWAVTAPDGQLLVAWWTPDGDLHVARGDATGPQEDQVLVEGVSGRNGNTDFAYLTLADGTAWAVWSDRVDGTVSLAHRGDAPQPRRGV